MNIEIFASSGLINGFVALSLGVFIIWHNWRAIKLPAEIKKQINKHDLEKNKKKSRKEK